MVWDSAAHQEQCATEVLPMNLEMGLLPTADVIDTS